MIDLMRKDKAPLVADRRPTHGSVTINNEGMLDATKVAMSPARPPHRRVDLPGPLHQMASSVLITQRSPMVR
ncbi:hypothetical protein [Frankia nepalensis]|uniref:hypothetical protein n=1 Tax=Frankia nepalensis TaxID=1836974 RepID=UPI001EE4CBD9|nr:hypothetical protein [Frankia nepalensis]